MMHMLGITFLGLFLWAIGVVHAQYPDLVAIGKPRIAVNVCTVRNNKCSYYFEEHQINQTLEYFIESADCNSAQKAGYTFTRAPEDKSFYVQSPCSGMSVDNLLRYNPEGSTRCMLFVGPICRRKTTT
ncbi:hypothetical protein BCR42DRAFT_393261 [Absidia repens]|uniref:Uncharacterized protein n=1 Tax=Absidia repens TaxID=90262 RepID=A0A1X2IFE1_9FUNG|nr:hypothetical protein BCR42DRAFT_393261 [Absidia repens]